MAINGNYDSAQTTAYRLGISKTWLIELVKRGRIHPPPEKMVNGKRSVYLFSPKAKERLTVVK